MSPPANRRNSTAAPISLARMPTTYAPIVPSVAPGGEEALPRDARVGVAEGVVVRQDRWPVVAPRLVRGHDIAEAGALVEDVVPGQGKALFLAGPVAQRDVGYEPRAIREVAHIAVVSVVADDGGSEELRRCEENSFRMD